jgi:hypothetical protein
MGQGSGTIPVLTQDRQDSELPVRNYPTTGGGHRGPAPRPDAG